MWHVCAPVYCLIGTRAKRVRAQKTRLQLRRQLNSPMSELLISNNPTGIIVVIRERQSERESDAESRHRATTLLAAATKPFGMRSGCLRIRRESNAHINIK